MKESRYIELLNLYLDHQLSPQETAELEAEVQRNPERRHLYSQYCQLQKGCTLLFEADRSLAPKTAAVVTALDRGLATIEGFPGARLLSSWSVRIAGLAAAAACAAFVVVKFLPPIDSGSGSVAVAIQPVADTTIAAATPKPSENRMGAMASERTTAQEFHSVFIANSSLRAAANLEAQQQVAQPAPSGFEWLDNVALPTVRRPSAENLAFEPVSLKQTAPPPANYSGRRLWQGQAETAAFQFQR